jgi:hypothetical protein
MKNQLTLPRTERLFYFKITSSEWIETSDVTLRFGECKSDPCSVISLLFATMKSLKEVTGQIVSVV